MICCWYCLWMTQLPTIYARCLHATVVRVSMLLVWNYIGGVLILKFEIDSVPSPSRNVCFVDAGAIAMMMCQILHNRYLNLFAKTSTDDVSDWK